MREWLGMPVAASAHAGQVDQIMVLVHWLMLALFVGLFRRRPTPVEATGKDDQRFTTALVPLIEREFAREEAGQEQAGQEQTAAR